MVQRTGFHVVAKRVMAVDRVVGVVPVDQRIVEADLQSLGPARFHEGTDQVATGRGVRRLVVGQVGLEQAEAVVMLGGDDGVLHAGRLGITRPLAGVVEVRVEVVEIRLVIGLGNAFAGLDPLVPRSQ